MEDCGLCEECRKRYCIYDCYNYECTHRSSISQFSDGCPHAFNCIGYISRKTYLKMEKLNKSIDCTDSIKDKDTAACVKSEENNPKVININQNLKGNFHNKDKIKFKKFLELYDNWNGITVVNDNNLKRIVKDNTLTIFETRKDLHKKEVVSFGFYDNQLFIRVK